MTYFRTLLASVLVCGTTSCATHPLPEDVRTDNTYAIVKKIRCEARFAIRDKLANYLQDPTVRPDVSSR